MKSTHRMMVVIAAATLVALPLFSQTPEPERRKVIVGENIRVVAQPEGKTFVVAGPGAYLGISTTNLSDELRLHFGGDADAGVLVSKVYEDTPAESAGIRVGDMIVAVDGKPVESTWDVSGALREKEKGDQVRIDVIRDRVPQQFFATVEERNEPMKFRFEEGALARRALELDLRELPRLDDRQFRAMALGPDCESLRERLTDLEAKMKELEKKLK